MPSADRDRDRVETIFFIVEHQDHYKFVVIRSKNSLLFYLEEIANIFY